MVSFIFYVLFFQGVQKLLNYFCETQIDFEKECYALVENHSLLCISFSMILSNIDSNDMGL